MESIKLSSIALLLLAATTNALSGLAASAEGGEEWIKTTVLRVIIKSTADWGRLLLDDLNGRNSNGIRIATVLAYGWAKGNDEDDLLFVGVDVPWPDVEFDRPVIRRGDMVAFFKAEGDFDYVELYADLILEINAKLDRLYVWLMIAGFGCTDFSIQSKASGRNIWSAILCGSGRTQHIKRILFPETFLREGQAEYTVVIGMLLAAVAIVIMLNLPIGLRKRYQHHA